MIQNAQTTIPPNHRICLRNEDFDKKGNMNILGHHQN